MNGTKVALGKSGSIAARLTFWYALLSVVLISGFGGVMYSVLKDRLRSEDDQILAGRIAELRSILTHYKDDYTHLREEIEREATSSPGTHIRVLDGRGKIVAESGESGTFSVSALSLPSLKLPKNGLGHDWIASDGTPYRVMAGTFVADTRYMLYVAMNLSSEEQLLSAYWRTLSFVIFAALIIAVAMGYYIARKGLQPVSRLATIVDELDAHGLHRRVSKDSWPEELQPMAAKFDGLLSRLEDSFGRLSRFSADIAHELRTPLHILRGEAEIVLTKGESKNDFRACIESATEEYERLSRMVEALLFLARTEQPDAQLDKGSLLLEQEVAAVCAFYQAMADENGVSLSAHGEGTVFADSALLRRALGNLVANSLRHTHNNGQVVVEARQTLNHGAVITVSDTGDGIAPEDLPYVFDRFYRADSARSRGDTGTGLGLAIVSSIMKLHGGTVSIQSERQHGSVVKLMFPPQTTPFAMDFHNEVDSHNTSVSRSGM